MSKIDRLRQRLAATGLPDDFDEAEDIDFNKSDRDNLNPDTPNLPWGKRQFDRRELIYKTRPKKLHKRKDRLEKSVKSGEEPATRFMKPQWQSLKKGTRKSVGVLAKPGGVKYDKTVTEPDDPYGGNLDWSHGNPGDVEYSHRQPVTDSFVQESPGYSQYKSYDMSDAVSQHQEEMAFVESGRKIQPRKPTRMDWRSIITAKQLRQRIARLRTAKPIIQETGEGIDFIRRPPKGPTRGRTYGWHKVPMHPSNAILIRPNNPTEQMDMIKHFRKIQNTKDFAPQVHGSVQQFLPLRHLRNNVMHMSGQPFRRHATISRAQGKSFKKGDIVMRRVGGKPEEGRYGTVGDTFYIEQDSPKGEMYTAKVRLAYAGPPQDVINAFRNKEALKFREKPKGRKDEYAFQTDGKTLYQSGYPIAKHTEKGVKFSYQKHPTQSTAAAGRMLGINTFNKKGKYYINGQEVNADSYDYVEVPFKDIQKGTAKVNPNAKVRPMTPEQRQKIKDQDYFSTKARREFKDPETGQVYDQVVIQPKDQKKINKLTGLDTPIPEETFAADIHHGIPVEKYPELIRSTAGATPVSKKSHREVHFPEMSVKNPISKLTRRKLKNARLKIARMRQRNISRRVTQINMAKEDYDPDNAWFEIDRELNRLENTPGSKGNWTYHKGKLVNFEHEKDTLDLLDSVEGDQNYSMFSVSNTHDIVDRKDPQLKTKFNEFVKQGFKPTIGKWEGKFDATVNFRDKDRKQVEKIARGELNEFGKPIRAQQSYVETTEIPRKTPTGSRKFKTKFFNYNEETDTYEE